MFDRILVPTDGSERAEGAVDHGADLAAHHDATLHVLNVADTDRGSVLQIGGEVGDVLESEGEAIVVGAAERARERDVEVVTAVEQGPPHRTILDYVRARDIDLVVMATHGRQGIERLLLGSVTERVLRLSDVPVLTVRPGVRIRHPYESVLVATDGSDCAELAIDVGVGLAGVYDAPLHALGVVDNSGLGIDVRTETVTDLRENRIRDAVENAGERIREAGVAAEEAVEFGTPHRAIREYAEEAGVDLVVVGTHGRTGLDRYLLGSVTDRVIRTAPVPVLAVRQPDEKEGE